MSYDENDPNVVAHRLKAVEVIVRDHIQAQKERDEKLDARFDKATEKIDELIALIHQTACKAPGTCVQLAESLRRLEQVVGMHEDQLQRIWVKLAYASGGGAVVATALALGVQYFSK